MKWFLTVLLALAPAGCSVVRMETHVEVIGDGSSAIVRVDPGEVSAAAEHAAELDASIPSAAVEQFPMTLCED